MRPFHPAPVQGVALIPALALVLIGWGAARPALERGGQATRLRPLGQDSTALVRYHFDEPIELKLDPDRIAVWAPDGLGPVLPAFIAPGGVEAMSVRGWHLLRLRTPVDGPGLPALLDGFAPAPGCAYVSPVFVDDLGGPLVPGPDILVQFEPDVGPAQAEAVLAASGAGEILDLDWAGLPRAYRLRSARADGLSVLSSANELARRSDVRFAEPDFIFTGQASQGPDDPRFARSWAVASPAFRDYQFNVDWDLGGPEAWKVTMGDPGVRVLVLDCGVDPLHPDLNLSPGMDFTGDGGGGAPVGACDNHGTSVAGCIAMKIDNGIGSVGIAPRCKVVSARIWQMRDACDNIFTTSSIWHVNALNWAVGNQIWITNCSGYYGFTSAAIEAKYQQTRDMGAIHFASAGNAVGPVSYPGSIPGVNAVGVSDANGELPSAAFGPGLDFVAPGVQIFTTDRSGPDGVWPGDYLEGSGSSFSSAFAAGVAALLRSVHPDLDAAAIEGLMRISAFDLLTPGWDERSGWGLIRADRALTWPRLRQARSLGGAPDSPGPIPLGDPRLEPVGSCSFPSFSGDGRYAAFISRSEKLVAGDHNRVDDVFWCDLQGGIVQEVSVDPMGGPADSNSIRCAISADGRYVAFSSRASNLVPNDTNGWRDVFVRDMQTGTTTRVSEGTGGIQGDNYSRYPCISADGRYVVFQSYASNFDLAANGYGQIYVHDRNTGTTTLVTKNLFGQAANRSCYLPSISANASRVVFFGNASNLVPGIPVSGEAHAFVGDVGSSTFQIASLDNAGMPNPSGSLRPTISGDGNRVAFWTLGALDTADTNEVYDLYVRDLTAGTTKAASTDAGGIFGTRESVGLGLSYDGRYVVVLTAEPLDPADTNGWVDVYRKDLSNDAVVRVSVGTGGTEATAGSTNPWIAPDGDMLGFVCDDDLLTPGDAPDGWCDVYLHTISSGVTVLVSGGS